MQFKVVKNDGRMEDYIQTKILRTLSNALADYDAENISTAQQLTDAITFHLFNMEKVSVITTCEIHSMLKAVLMQTGFENAAVALHQNHYHRIIKRNQIEVINISINSLADAKMFYEIKNLGQTQQWDKAIIVDRLIQEYEFNYVDARAIASAVEEKVLNSSCNCITTDYIKQLVLLESAGFINAKKMITEPERQKRSKTTPAKSPVSYIRQSQSNLEKELALI